jgi:hypothetical protein
VKRIEKRRKSASLLRSRDCVERFVRSNVIDMLSAFPRLFRSFAICSLIFILSIFFSTHPYLCAPKDPCLPSMPMRYMHVMQTSTRDKVANENEMI